MILELAVFIIGMLVGAGLLAAGFMARHLLIKEPTEKTEPKKRAKLTGKFNSPKPDRASKNLQGYNGFNPISSLLEAKKPKERDELGEAKQ